jgi:hypothetical protein
MMRSIAIIVLALAVAACAAEEPRRQVVRLDLDEIAAATAARDRSPGFESLGPAGNLPRTARGPTSASSADGELHQR